MNYKEILKMRTPLELVSLSIMVCAILMMTLTLFYIFGVNIISLFIPEIPDPYQITFNFNFETLIDFILPLVSFFSVIYILFLPLKYVLSQKNYRGYRAELILIGYSLLMIVFALQFLELYIPYSGDFKNSLLPFSLLPLFLAIIIFLIAIVYRYFIDDILQTRKDFFAPIFLIILLLCMALTTAFFIYDYVQQGNEDCVYIEAHIENQAKTLFESIEIFHAMDGKMNFLDCKRNSIWGITIDNLNGRAISGMFQRHWYLLLFHTKDRELSICF